MAGFDDLEDFDMEDEFDPFSESPQDDRNPIISAVTGTGESFINQFKSDAILDTIGTEKLNILKSAGGNAHAAGNTINDLDKLTQHAVKSIKREGAVIGNAAASVLPDDGFLGGVKEAISSFFEENDNYSGSAAPDYEQMAQSAVTAALGARRSPEEKLEAKKTELIGVSSNKLLAKISSSVNNSSTFISFQEEYYRKSLELQYKQYYITKESLDLDKATAMSNRDLFNSIVKNTALPDFLKTTTTEMIKQAMVPGLTSSLTDSLLKKTDIQAKLSGMIDDKLSGIDAISDMVDATEDISIKDAASGMAVNTATDYLGSKVGKLLSMTNTGKAAVTNLNSFMANPSKFLTKKADGKEGVIGSILNFGSELLDNPMEKTIGGATIEGRDTATRFTAEAAKSITRVIPEMLGNIHQAILNNHVLSVDGSGVYNYGTPAKAMFWDYDNDKFSERKNVMGDLRNKVDLSTSGLENDTYSLVKDMEDKSGIKLNERERLRLYENILNHSLEGGGSALDADITLTGNKDGTENAKYKQMFEKYTSGDDGVNRDQAFTDTTTDMASSFKSPDAWLTKQIRDGRGDELLADGMVKFSNGRYIMDVGKYQKMIKNSIKKRIVKGGDSLYNPITTGGKSDRTNAKIDEFISKHTPDKVKKALGKVGDVGKTIIDADIETISKYAADAFDTTIATIKNIPEKSKEYKELTIKATDAMYDKLVVIAKEAGMDPVELGINRDTIKAIVTSETARKDAKLYVEVIKEKLKDRVGEERLAKYENLKNKGKDKYGEFKVKVSPLTNSIHKAGKDLGESFVGTQFYKDAADGTTVTNISKSDRAQEAKSVIAGTIGFKVLRHAIRGGGKGLTALANTELGVKITNKLTELVITHGEKVKQNPNFDKMLGTVLASKFGNDVVSNLNAMGRSDLANAIRSSIPEFEDDGKTFKEDVTEYGADVKSGVINSHKFEKDKAMGVHTKDGIPLAITDKIKQLITKEGIISRLDADNNLSPEKRTILQSEIVALYNDIMIATDANVAYGSIDAATGNGIKVMVADMMKTSSGTSGVSLKGSEEVAIPKNKTDLERNELLQDIALYLKPDEKSRDGSWMSRLAGKNDTSDKANIKNMGLTGKGEGSGGNGMFSNILGKITGGGWKTKLGIGALAMALFSSFASAGEMDDFSSEDQSKPSFLEKLLGKDFLSRMWDGAMDSISDSINSMTNGLFGTSAADNPDDTGVAGSIGKYGLMAAGVMTLPKLMMWASKKVVFGIAGGMKNLVTGTFSSMFGSKKLKDAAKIDTKSLTKSFGLGNLFKNLIGGVFKSAGWIIKNSFKGIGALFKAGSIKKILGGMKGGKAGMIASIAAAIGGGFAWLGGGSDDEGAVDESMEAALGAEPEFKDSAMLAGGVLGATAIGHGITKITAKKVAGKVTAKGVALGAAKMVGKRVPLLGLGIGTAAAVGRIQKGEYGMAAAEFFSGLLSTIPLFGTAGSILVDGAIMKHDYDKNKEKLLETREKEVVVAASAKEKTLTKSKVVAEKLVLNTQKETEAKQKAEQTKAIKENSKVDLEIKNKPIKDAKPPVGYVSARVKALLIFIATAEGTFRHGYDTTYAYGKYDPSPVKITQLPIRELYEFQNGMLKNQKGNKLRSTAVGMYQFMRDTLKEFIPKLKDITEDSLFDPLTQDKIAEAFLYKYVKYSKWLDGKITDKQFALQLSYKWASLPDPSTGKSHYGQHTAKTVTEVLTMLASLRHIDGNAKVQVYGVDAKDATSYKGNATPTLYTQAEKEIDSKRGLLDDLIHPKEASSKVNGMVAKTAIGFLKALGFHQKSDKSKDDAITSSIAPAPIKNPASKLPTQKPKAVYTPKAKMKRNKRTFGNVVDIKDIVATTRNVTKITVIATSTDYNKPLDATGVRDAFDRQYQLTPMPVNFTINLDGTIQYGASMAGGGFVDPKHDDSSIYIAYVGGMTPGPFMTAKVAVDKATPAQMKSMINLTHHLVKLQGLTTSSIIGVDGSDDYGPLLTSLTMSKIRDGEYDDIVERQTKAVTPKRDKLQTVRQELKTAKKDVGTHTLSKDVKSENKHVASSTSGGTDKTTPAPVVNVEPANVVVNVDGSEEVLTDILDVLVTNSKNQEEFNKIVASKLGGISSTPAANTSRPSGGGKFNKANMVSVASE